jgi:hypothetical protein
VIQQFESVLFGYILLQSLDFFANELDDIACFDADHMIVVIAVVQLEYRMATLEVVSCHEARRLKLRKDTIHSGKADIFTGLQQVLIKVLRTQMALLGTLENLENLQSGQSDFEAGFAKFLSLLHEQTLSRYDARLL